MKILAIIPAFNEERTIAAVVTDVKEHISDVLVVDDASSDQTGEEARQAGAVVVRHPINLGYASALQTGYKYALQHTYSRLVQLDGDGQHNPDDIPKLLDLLDSADLVIGERFSGAGNYTMPTCRFIGKSIFSFFIRMATGRVIMDPTSGFQALSQRAIRLFATDCFADEYPDADMLILALRHGLTVMETGVTMHHNTTGQSIHAGLIAPLYYMLRMSIGVLVSLCTKIRKIP